MKEDTLERKYKTFMLWGIILTIVGLFLICIGILMYIFGKPQSGTNLATLQPMVIDGTQPLFLGFAILLIGCYRLIFKKKAFKEIIELDNQQKVDKHMNYLKNSGYRQKKRKKRVKTLRKKVQK